MNLQHFIEVSHLDFYAICNRIAADGIHILINLNGYTKGTRNEIFAVRPAPVQMLYMGFPGTMGADYIDYLVTDNVVSPPHLEWVYHEKLLRMPHSYFVNDHRQAYANIGIVPPDIITSYWVSAATPALQPHGIHHPPLASYEWYQTNGMAHLLGMREALRARYGLPPFATLFCCFNRASSPGSNYPQPIAFLRPHVLRCVCAARRRNSELYKLDPATFSAWCRILRAVPNSVLWLLKFPVAAVTHINDALAKAG